MNPRSPPCHERYHSSPKHPCTPAWLEEDQSNLAVITQQTWGRPHPISSWHLSHRTILRRARLCRVQEKWNSYRMMVSSARGAVSSCCVSTGVSAHSHASLLRLRGPNRGFLSRVNGCFLKAGKRQPRGSPAEGRSSREPEGRMCCCGSPPRPVKLEQTYG